MVLQSKALKFGFKIDLIVWKYNTIKLISNDTTKFKIDLIVWK